MAELSQTAADPAALLARLAEGDPRLAMLMGLMKGRATEAEPAGEDSAALVSALEDRLEAAEALIARLRLGGRRLAHRTRAAEARLSELAAALGACGLCWGADPACPGCRGRGRPGMVRPDPAARTRLFGAPPPRHATIPEGKGVDPHA